MSGTVSFLASNSEMHICKENRWKSNNFLLFFVGSVFCILLPGPLPVFLHIYAAYWQFVLTLYLGLKILQFLTIDEGEGEVIYQK